MGSFDAASLNGNNLPTQINVARVGSEAPRDGFMDTMNTPGGWSGRGMIRVFYGGVI